MTLSRLSNNANPKLALVGVAVLVTAAWATKRETSRLRRVGEQLHEASVQNDEQIRELAAGIGQLSTDMRSLMQMASVPPTVNLAELEVRAQSLRLDWKDASKGFEAVPPKRVDPIVSPKPPLQKTQTMTAKDGQCLLVNADDASLESGSRTFFRCNGLMPGVTYSIRARGSIIASLKDGAFLSWDIALGAGEKTQSRTGSGKSPGHFEIAIDESASAGGTVTCFLVVKRATIDGNVNVLVRYGADLRIEIRPK